MKNNCIQLYKNTIDYLARLEFMGFFHEKVLL